MARACRDAWACGDGMKTCPRDGGELTPTYAQSRAVRPGQRLQSAPVLVGWWCEVGHHTLDKLGERPVEDASDE
jgi:hypothetical protein